MASNITTLVEKAKQGDADAFSTLYQMYYPKMKGICINILREDKAVVDDLVQDAFIFAFVSLKDLKNTHRFSQWLTSITTNLVLKYQEKGKRYDFISLSDIEDEFSSVLEDGNTSKQSIPYEEIMAAIDSLPEGYKKIITCLFWMACLIKKSANYLILLHIVLPRNYQGQRQCCETYCPQELCLSSYWR